MSVRSMAISMRYLPKGRKLSITAGVACGLAETTKHNE